MATIAKLVVSLGADSAKLVKALSKTRKSVNKWAKNIAKTVAKAGAAFAGLGLIIGGALLVAINRNAEAIDNMTKAAGKLNFPIEDFQRFAFIAEKSNVSMDIFGKSMQRMLKTVGDARAGLTTASDAFDQLGLNADDLARLNPSQQFELIAEKMKGVASQSDKVKIAMDIFGRSGADLLNVFAGDVKGIGDEFDSLGITVTQRQADMVAAFQDSKTSLSAIFDGFQRKVTAEVSPALTAVVQKVTDLITEFGGLDKAAISFAKTIVKAASFSIKAFGKIADAALAAKLVIGTAFDLVGTAIGEQVAAFANGDLLVKAEISNLPKIINDFNAGAVEFGEIGRAAQSMADELDGITSNIGLIKNDSHVQALIANEEKLANEALKTANSMATLTKATTKTAQAAQVKQNSIKFQELFDLAKSSKEAKSSFAEGNFKSLENLLGALQASGGFGIGTDGEHQQLNIEGMVAAIEELRNATPPNAMQQMVDSLGDVKTATQQTAQAIQQTNQQPARSLGSLTLNMITNAGEIAGTIWAETEFLDRLTIFHGQQTQQTTRATVN